MEVALGGTLVQSFVRVGIAYHRLSTNHRGEAPGQINTNARLHPVPLGKDLVLQPTVGRIDTLILVIIQVRMPQAQAYACVCLSISTVGCFKVGKYPALLLIVGHHHTLRK